MQVYKFHGIPQNRFHDLIQQFIDLLSIKTDMIEIMQSVKYISNIDDTVIQEIEKNRN